jgi:nicotinate-nucleotide pyrophosphorylase (carboxylating)
MFVTKTLKHGTCIKNIVMGDIENYLKEDLGNQGDITSDSLFTSETAKAKIVVKQECIIAGIEEIKEIFDKLDIKTDFFVKDGESVKKNTIIAELNGKAISILKGERLALNIISRMSGIATETRKLVDKVKKINPNATVASTRKTTPGFRKYEKKAVVIGGGELHRMGLYDAVMIKDNHIKIAGSIETAVKTIKQKIKDKTIEVEVENYDDAIKVAKLGVDIIMLDNFTFENGKKTSDKIREINPNILIEISGGITPENIKDYASFADRISMGYLTHSVKSIDFSLEIV